MTYSLTNNVTSSFGVPLLHPPVFTGITSAVTPTTLSASGVTWTPNEFITGSAPHLVTIRTGAQAGRTLLVTGNTENTLTLDTEDTPLNAAGFAVVATTDSFELFQGDTLASLFGSTVDGSGYLPSGLKGAASTIFADAVQIYNGTRFVAYFFNTSVGNWVTVNGGTTSQNDFVLYPDDGLMITRRGPTATLTLVGRVPSTALLTKLPGGTSTVVAVRFPTDTTLGTLNFGSPGTWIKGSNLIFADSVSLWNGTKWVPYFKNTNNQWIQVNGDGSDQSAVVIPAGSAIQVTKRGSANGALSFLGQALPYTP